MNNPINISIIDDNDIYQFTMKVKLELLDSVGKIKIFNDGLEAMDFILDNLNNVEELPDIIFLDINMPVMDGFQFMDEYSQIKSQVNKRIIIYMVSSSVDPADNKKARQFKEVYDCIVKPINQNQLKDILQNFDENLSLI